MDLWASVCGCGRQKEIHFFYFYFLMYIMAVLRRCVGLLVTTVSRAATISPSVSG